jgi:hypothetical protein
MIPFYGLRSYFLDSIPVMTRRYYLGNKISIYGPRDPAFPLRYFLFDLDDIDHWQNITVSDSSLSADCDHVHYILNVVEQKHNFRLRVGADQPSAFRFSRAVVEGSYDGEGDYPTTTESATVSTTMSSNTSGTRQSSSQTSEPQPSSKG